MGNVHSSETPRKAPQKLSKPRTTQRPSNANDLHSIESAHFSNSYPVGRPLSAAQPTPSPNALRRSMTGLSEVPSEASRSPVDRSKERERRLSGIVRSNTSVHEYGHRHSMVAASIHSLEYQGRTRANSMVYVPGSRSFTGDRTISLSSQSRRGSVQYELPILEPRSPMFPDSTIPQVPPLPVAHMGGELVEAADAVPRSPRVQQAGSVNITRTNSEVSLYPPVRRRSIIRTPGVATRAPAPLTAKSSFRHSVPPSPSPSRRNSIDKNARRHTSMLPPSETSSPETRERVVTPCEEEYKQLGGIKFGSLRVINASPAPSSLHDVPQDPPRSTPDPVAGHSRPTRGVPLTLKTSGANTNSETKIAQPKPTSSLTSPVIATFSRPFLDNKEPNSAVETTANQIVHSPSALSFTQSPLAISGLKTYPEVASKPTGNEDGLFDAEPLAEFAKPEVLNVKDVSNARASASTPSKRGKTDTVARSDSGFASTSSSNGSGKPLSKTDSGYGSSLSLRSLRRSKSKSRTPSKKTSGSGVQPSELEDVVDVASTQSKKTEQVSSSTSDDHPSRLSSAALAMLSPSKSLSFTSTMSFSALRASRSRDTSTPKPSSRSRPKSGGVQQVPEIPTSTSSTQESESRHTKLQRFWSSNRRKSLPAQYAPSGDLEPIPPSPAFTSAQSEDQDTYLSIRSRQTALRMEPSKDTLKTILSVGSVEFTQAQDATVDTQGQPVTQYRHDHSAAAIGTTVTVDEISRPESRLGRRTLSKPHKKDFHTQAPPQYLKSRSSAPNFLSIDPNPSPSALQDVTSLKGSRTPPPLSMRRRRGSNSALQQLDHQQVANINPSPRSPGIQYKSAARRRSYHPAGNVEYSVYSSPPYSPVTASRVGTMDFAYEHGANRQAIDSTRLRRGSTGQHMRQHSVLTSQHLTHNAHIEQMQALAPQSWGHASHTGQNSLHGKQEFSYPFAIEQPLHQVGRRVASNPTMSAHHCRESTDPRRYAYGQSPPYRILHSYDSPAYKNAPIWN